MFVLVAYTRIESLKERKERQNNNYFFPYNSSGGEKYEWNF